MGHGRLILPPQRMAAVRAELARFGIFGRTGGTRKHRSQGGKRQRTGDRERNLTRDWDYTE